MKFFFYFVLSVIFIPFTHAEEKDEPGFNKHLFELSLEELLTVNIGVEIESGESDNILKSSAIISSYSLAQLERLGISSLKDLLSFIPGITVQDGINGNMPVMIRGISEGFNQKVLFLIDDIPYTMSSHSDIPLIGIPVGIIDHVEVIRGPGASVHGSNATAGVIKIITKKSTKSCQKISYGSHNKFTSTGCFSKDIGVKGRVTVAHQFQIDSGYSSQFDGKATIPASYPSSTPVNGIINKQEEVKSILAKYSNQGYNLLFNIFRTETNGVAGSSTVINRNTLRYDSILLAANKSFLISDNTTVNLFLGYNRFYLTYFTDNFYNGDTSGGYRFADNGKKNYSYRYGFNFDYKPSSKLKSSAGIEFVRKSVGDYEMYKSNPDALLGTIISKSSMDSYDAHASMKYLFNSKVQLSAGARYSHMDSSSELSPKASIIYMPSKKQAIKLIYSVGYNYPSFTQKKANLSGVVEGSDNLKVEKIRTLDLSYMYSSGGDYFNLNGYHFRAIDFILKRRENNVIKFFNSGNFNRTGIEADYQKKIAEKLLLLVNGDYQVKGDTYSDYASSYVSRFSLSSGLGYQLSDSHHLGLSLRYLSKRIYVKESFITNLKYEYRKDKLRVLLGVDNIFEDKRMFPNVSDFNDRVIQSGDPNRSYKLTLAYSF